MAESLSKPHRALNVPLILFCLVLLAHVWAVSVGWSNGNLPGNEFRQTQTAVTALFVQRDHDFSIKYPTPVLGKPWSVPFEFPLYQWTVAALSDATGLPLVECGRLVTAVCFYLTLPAIWLLLKRLNVAPATRWLALAITVASPLYIFYARAFLIETMALFFALWCFYAVIEALTRRSVTWLVLANVLGMGAGLVKITTWMVYLVPTGCWILWWLMRSETTQGGEKTKDNVYRKLVWAMAALALPLAVSYFWIQFADACKVMNPGSRSLTSSAMMSYNFGSADTRFSPEIWRAHWRIMVTNIMPVWTVLVALVGVVFARRKLLLVAACLALFAATQVTFPILYAWHEYYYTAIALLVTVGVGLLVGAVAETNAVPKVLGYALAGAIIIGEFSLYFGNLYQLQRAVDIGGSEITDVIRSFVPERSVLIIAGEDWNSMTPFFAQRKSLMIRRSMENDGSFLKEAFTNLQGESVGALVLSGEQQDNQALLARACDQFGLEAKPALVINNTKLFVSPEILHAMESQPEKLARLGAGLARDGNPSENPMRKKVVKFEDLPVRMQIPLRDFKPLPSKIYTTFGLSPLVVGQGRFVSAHPDSSFWFKVAAGKRSVSAEFAIAAAAYEGLRREDATDGVQFSIYYVPDQGPRQVIFERMLAPATTEADRGVQQLRIERNFETAGELEFETRPGPAQNYSRDWAGWGAIRIE